MKQFERTCPTMPVKDAIRWLHKFLSETEIKLMNSSVYENESESFKENGKEGLEKFITIRMYNILFRALGDPQEDAKMQRQIASLQWITFKHLGVDDVDDGMFDMATDQLRQMDSYKSPRDKLIVVMNTCRVIQRVVQQVRTANFSADDFLPLLIFVLLKANPKHLHSNTKFITEVRHPDRLRGEESYFFTNLCSAVSWVEHVKFDQLVGVTEAQFKQYCADEVKKYDLANLPEAPSTPTLPNAESATSR